MDETTDNALSESLSRRYQMFPVLSEAEVARVRRFGELRRYVRGERLFVASEAGLRRVPLIEAGASDPVLSGQPLSHQQLAARMAAPVA